MASPDSASRSFSNGRRWLAWMGVLLAMLAMLAIIVMANYLSAGHFKRFEWDQGKLFKLSDQTLHVLASLTNDVTNTIFFDRGPNAANEDIYQLTSSLLTEYQQACPRYIHVVTLDYDRDVGEAKEFLARHNLSGLPEKDFVMVESGGYSKTVYARELANYDVEDLLSGRSKYVRRSAFLGELFLTESIYDVSNPHPLKAYFLTGHGENDPEEAKAKNGYSKLAGILKDELNCNWAKLSLEGTNDIPPDCQLLIVAASAAQKQIPKAELDKIAAYLKQGGRLLALLTAPSGLENVLLPWGVEVGPSGNRVVDLDKNFNQGGSKAFLTAILNKAHFIMEPLVSERMPILMVYPRAVGEPANHSKLPGGPTVTSLATTSSQGVDDTGQTGVYPLLASVEQGGIQGVGGGTRIVVAGDSDFLDDTVINMVLGNHTFAKRAMAWLLQRPEVMLSGLGPRPIREYRLFMTEAQAQALRWLLLGALPGSVLLVGGLVWLRRRS